MNVHDISLRARQVEDASRLRWAKNAGIEVGRAERRGYTVPDGAEALERERLDIEEQERRRGARGQTA